MSCEDIPSLLDLQNAKKNIDDLGRLMGTGEGDSTNEVTRQVRPTFNKVMNEMNSEFDAQIANMGYTRVGTFKIGYTLTNTRQTLLWDVADGGDGQEYGWSGAFPKVVPPDSTPDSTGGIAVGAWMSRLDPALKVQVRETQSRSYAESGYNLVAGSFEAGGVLVNANDVLLYETLGKAYTGPSGNVPAGTDPASGGFIDVSGNIIDRFYSIQEMLASGGLINGQKVKTGATTWKISSSVKGWPLDNGAQYAIPLNGVWVEDAGADATGESDSFASIMFVVSNYNADTRRRFALCFGGGHYKTSGEIALHQLASDMHINFAGATLEATSNMDALLSCPSISGLRIDGVKVQHSDGVVIANAMIHLNRDSAATTKTTRHVIDDISSGNIKGAPLLLLCERMWESKIGRIRCDRDVAGNTGEIVRLNSCVNCVVDAGEIGYCDTAWRLSKSASVSYGCEGITFNGGITTFAKVPVAIDSGASIRLIGMVLDFCLTSGPTISNGVDITLDSCWIANLSTSGTGWNGVISLPSASRVKVTGNHFVNNSTNIANCASLNSASSSFTGNTSEGCQPGFRQDGQVQELGNKYGINGLGSNSVQGASFEFRGDSGVAQTTTFRSGVNTHQANQLLQRVRLTAPGVNASNLVYIDHYSGNFADQSIIKIGWNATDKYTLNLVTGDIEILNRGRGIRLTSPNGSITKTLRLSDSGAIELI